MPWHVKTVDPPVLHTWKAPFLVIICNKMWFEAFPLPCWPHASIPALVILQACHLPGEMEAIDCYFCPCFKLILQKLFSKVLQQPGWWFDAFKQQPANSSLWMMVGLFSCSHSQVVNNEGSITGFDFGEEPLPESFARVRRRVQAYWKHSSLKNIVVVIMS